MEFKCAGDDLEQIPAEVIKETGLTFPEVHIDKQKIAVLAQALREYKGDVFCRVPFCVTVEAEAFGAEINLGNAHAGPRVANYTYETLEKLSGLQSLDLTKGRIREVLGAAAILADNKETVALNVEGPFTIISSLIDPMNFYRELRKDPERVRVILNLIENELIRYSLKGIEQGAAIISYGDPVGAMDVVGPKIYREFSGPSSFRIIQGIRAAAKGKKVIIHICGKTSTALEKLEMIEVSQIKAGEAVTYGQALTELLKTISEPVMLGHRCIKQSLFKMRESVLWMIQ